MKTPGKISEHFKGIGTVTPQMVTERAQEIARINGHEHLTEDDWLQAKREMIGIENFEDVAEEQAIESMTRWDEEPGSTGHQVPNMEPTDEQTLSEHLVEEGLNEAEHDQMLQSTRREQI